MFCVFALHSQKVKKKNLNIVLTIHHAKQNGFQFLLCMALFTACREQPGADSHSSACLFLLKRKKITITAMLSQ